MVCSFDVTEELSVRLAWVTEAYIEGFSKLYQSGSITPKMHHLVHLPEQIMLYVKGTQVYTHNSCRYFIYVILDLAH